LIEFAPHTTIRLEQNRVSPLPIVGNGPPGTFVVFPDGLHVSLPTDQIVFTDAERGCARVGFGGMRFAGVEDGALIFHRVRELYPEDQLSPARSHTMILETRMVSAIWSEGRLVWTGSTGSTGSSGAT
jgi:hypothetical protein